MKEDIDDMVSSGIQAPNEIVPTESKDRDRSVRLVRVVVFNGMPQKSFVNKLEKGVEGL